ncbi:cell division protein FtsX [Ectothiorhodospira shaposhnikovii]|uniref:permease-like cell division protein FtsX n=1 Tax=Ectothiorhodospira shaposhnikovii TaxID=1054 RepID=UPI001905F365|nr:permease-like cell division protein FtsX [Ectothiorhodospira shaposhnikovii]MBK1672687.1 cell division protein FtsX [Ectothiorhodospira shaposhnikovii]
MRRRRALTLPPVHARFQAYAINHLRALVFSLGKLYRAPFSSALTLLVIAVALTLPTLFHVVLDNLQQVSPQWSQTAQISVFLQDSVADEQLPALATRLAQRPDVAEALPVTRVQALEEFRAHSGFAEALDTLGENPLPPLILVTPALDHRSTAAMEGLVNALNNIPEVSRALLDLQWVQRLFSIMEMLQRSTLILSLLLSLGVLVVVGNTIRLDVQNRREEIEVAKLVGATDAFIRRPFLYGGLWLGLGGAMMAALIVTITTLLLSGPLQTLSQLYGGEWRIHGLGFRNTLILLGLGALLGLAGSWITVNQHLRHIEPR